MKRVGWLLGMVVLLFAGDVAGQSAELSVQIQGRLIQVYRSRDGVELLEVQLESVAAPNVAQSVPDMPTPQETIYIQIQTARRDQLPKVGERLQGVIKAGTPGTWSATELVSANDLPGDDGIARFRGLECEAVVVRGRLGLKVKQVRRDTPAQQAGFERGDVIIGIDDQPIVSAADLQRVGPEPRPIDLQVVDVNSGRVAEVTVEAVAKTAPAPRAPAPRAPADNRGPQIRDLLGVTFEEGPAEGVRVTAVRRDSPGGRAGLEVGDLVVEIGNKRVNSLAEFADALPVRPRTVTLVVRDVRTGRDVPVKVEFGPPGSAPPASTDSDSGTNRLGIAAELAFFNAEAAVKVTRVLPDSPADRAGIRAGVILQKANGEPLLHPDELTKLANEGRPIRLQGTDPATRREFAVEVSP